MPRLVRKRVHIREHILLVVHENVWRRVVTTGGKCPTAFAFVFVTIAPASRAQTFRQHSDVFLSQWSERIQHHFDRFIECESSLDLRNEGNVRVIVMQFTQTKDPPAKIEISK